MNLCNRGLLGLWWACLARNFNILNFLHFYWDCGGLLWHVLKFFKFLDFKFMKGKISGMLKLLGMFAHA